MSNLLESSFLELGLLLKSKFEEINVRLDALESAKPPDPPVPSGRAFSHIRTWSTPYAVTDVGDPVPDDIRQWFDSHYDLIVTARPDLWNAMPNTQVYLYQNYNNIPTYATDRWRAWHERFGDREDVYARYPDGSRVTYKGTHQDPENRWHVDVRSPEVQQFWYDWTKDRMEHFAPYVDGIMEDNGFISIVGNVIPMVEWMDGSIKCIERVKEASGRPVIVNVGTGTSSHSDALARAGGILETESFIGPFFTDSHFTQRLDSVAQRVIDMPVLLEAGMSPPAGFDADQHAVACLAQYYLLMSDEQEGRNPTYFYYGGRGHRAVMWDGNKSEAWFGAMEFDVGAPLSGTYLYAAGEDPEGVGEYKIYGREFENALVLQRPRTRWDSSYNAGVTVLFDEKLRPLHRDGSLMPAVDSHLLKSGHGMILVK